MKLHLPLPLRSALLAVCALASFTSFSRAVVFENYEDSATDAFKEKYGEGPSYTIEDELHFRNNHRLNDDWSRPGGGALYVDGDITFRNCGELEMTGNYIATGGGGALCATGRVVFEGIEKVNLSGNYGRGEQVNGGAIATGPWPWWDGEDSDEGIVFRNCGDVEITGNYAQDAYDYLLEEHLSFNTDSGDAHAWYFAYFPYSAHSGAMDFKDDLVFEANDRVVIRGNYSMEKRDGGWCYALTAFFSDVTGMKIKVKEGQSFECYDSGWIAGVLYINGDKEHLTPDKDDANRYRGTVTFSGKHTEEDLEKIMGRKLTAQDIEHGVVNFSRVMHVKGVQVCDGTLVLEDGAILYAELWRHSEFWQHPEAPEPEEFKYSGFNVRESGRLVMRDATIYTEEILGDGYQELGRDQGVLSGGKARISSASFSGANTIYAYSLESTGGTWTFNVSEKNLTDSLVTLKFHVPYEKMTEDGTWVNSTGPGTFTSREGTVFDIQFEGTLAAGKYKLLEFDKTDGTWEHEAGIPEITGKANSTTIGEAGKGDVYLTAEGDTVTLIFDVASAPADPEPAPEDRQPTTLTWGNGNGTWADGKGNEDGHWAGEVTDKNFYKGDSVVFGSAAEVTLQGVIRPGSVLVNNADGTVKFTGSGQITDVDIPSQRVKLTKEGAGTLEIDTNNAYTGGTELKAGTLVTGNAGALGLGAVRVSGGTLDMGGNALVNELDVAGTANVTNGGKYAGKLVLESGVLNGDLNLEQDAELKRGTVAGVLNGKGGVAVSGDVTLSGANTYTGKTTVQGGGNLHVTGSLASRELEVQGGGTYSGAISGTGLNVNLAGGAIAGDVTLGKGSTLRATAQGAAVKGKLSVASGGRLSVRDVQEGATLSVSELVADGGKLALDPAKPGALDVGTFTTTANRTALDVGDVLYRDSGTYTLLNYETLGSGSSVDALYLAALEGLHSRKEFKLDLRATSLTLSISGETQSLTWQGSTGVWTNESGHAWQTGESGVDNNFYDLDDVKFVDAEDVKIQGNVAPGSIEVEVGEGKTTTFTNVDDKTLGHIRGSAPLTKEGKGTLAIETDNSEYTGDITVKAGTLKAGHTNAFGSGNVFVNGATFDANSLNVAAKVTMRGQSTLENASNVKSLTFDSEARVKSSTGYTLASGNTLTIGPTGSASYSGDFTFGGGTLALTGGVFDLSGAKVTFSEGTRSVLDLSGWEGLTSGQEYTLFVGDIATDMLDVRLGNGMDGAARLEERDGKIVLVIGTPGGLGGSDGAEYATAISNQTEGNMAHLRRLRGAIGSGQALSSDRKVGAYITGYTEDNRLEQDAQGLGYHRTEIGGTLGVETARRDGQFVVGAALSAGRAHVSPTGPAPRYHEDVIREDLYLVASVGRLRSTTTVGLGQHEIDVRRAGASSQDVSGNSVNLSEELAVTFSRNEKHSFESFFAVESSYNRIEGFSEGGANTAALNVDAHEAFATDLSLGLRANFLFPIVSGAPSAVFSVQGAAITSVGDTVADVTMRYAGTPDSYSVRSAKRNRWGYSAGASLTVPVSPNAAIFGSSEAVLRGDSHEITATLGVKLTF